MAYAVFLEVFKEQKLSAGNKIIYNRMKQRALIKKNAFISKDKSLNMDLARADDDGFAITKSSKVFIYDKLRGEYGI